MHRQGHKARKPYEFGVKSAVMVTHQHDLMLGARTFPGNPYYGHILSAVLEQATNLTQDLSSAVAATRGRDVIRCDWARGDCRYEQLDRYRCCQETEFWSRRAGCFFKNEFFMADSIVQAGLYPSTNPLKASKVIQRSNL